MDARFAVYLLHFLKLFDCKKQSIIFMNWTILSISFADKRGKLCG